jgi:rod shape-determining protein MreD
MFSLILNNIFRFLFFTILQISIVQYMDFGAYCIPLLYLIAVLMLPFETPAVAVILICFAQGLVIDIFYDQQGLHAASCVLLGFLRPYVLKLISPREGYDTLMKPTASQMGTAWFITYAGSLIFFHHLVYFYLEVFRFTEFFSTLLRVVVSSMATLLAVYIIHFLFYRNEKGLS